MIRHAPRLCFCLCLLLPLAGCGQKGPLYLPSSPPAPTPRAGPEGQAPASTPDARRDDDQRAADQRNKDKKDAPSASPATP